MRAFVRYDNKGIIVPTSFVMKKTVPKVGQWKEISTSKSVSGSPAESSQKNLRAFVRYNGKNKVVAGSIVLRGQVPTGNFSELTYDLSRPLGSIKSPAFIITIDTRLGIPDNKFEIGVERNYVGNFNIKTSDGQLLEGLSEGTLLTFPKGDIYDIEITGEWTSIKFGIGKGLPYSDKVINLKNWGNIEFLDVGNSFTGCINMIITAKDIPNMSNVTDMRQMFDGCELITSVPNINSWDTSNVTYMSWMFRNNTSFNQDLSTLDVSNVTFMRNMFENASSFNQDLSSWSVDGVTQCEDFSTNATSWTLPKPTFTNCTP